MRLHEEVYIFFCKIKRRIWNKRVQLWWHKLWIRKDEMHHSLNLNSAAMLEMNQKEREEYLKNLESRRKIACRKGNPIKY